MSQNTSHAVMAQRHESKDSRDDFPTPPWATRALLEHCIPPETFGGLIHEPACGRGDMARVLMEYVDQVSVGDIHDYGFPLPEGSNTTIDFLDEQREDLDAADWIITNPPFNKALAFTVRARELADVGVAMLVRTAFLETVNRYNTLFSPLADPPNVVAIFSERVPMLRGRLDPKGSTATSYAWIVWNNLIYAKGRTTMQWIPPCRRELEQPGDYDLYQQGE